MGIEFVERPATKKSLSRRRLVYGVGINDAAYLLSYKVGEVLVTCPYYSRWVSMLARCYSKPLQKVQPRYKGSSVAGEWLLFSTFKCWMEQQDWENKALDKDILVAGNSVYSQDTCIFVSQALNNLLSDRAWCRGSLPQGVTLHKRDKRYRAQCNMGGGRVFLGSFTDSNSASVLYCLVKSSRIDYVARQEEASCQPELQEALFARATLQKRSGRGYVKPCYRGV